MTAVVPSVSNGPAPPSAVDDDTRPLAVRYAEAERELAAAAARLDAEDSAVRRSAAGTGADDFADVMTAADLMSRELPVACWLVPGVIPEGSVLLAAKPKVGKSRLALNVAVAVATGGVALGVVPVTAGRVLYIAGEGTLRTLQETISRMLDGGPVPERLHIATEWPTGRAGADRIEAFVARYPDTRLVVLDTLKRLRAQSAKGATLYDADYDGASPFGDLPKRLPGTTLLAIHHASKRDAATTDDAFDLVSGSTGLTGAFDSVAVLTRGPVAGESGARLFVRGRDTEELAVALAWDARLTTWTYRGDAGAVEASAERQAVRAVVAEAGPSGLEAREVVDALRAEYPGVVKGDGSNVRHLLRKMALDADAGFHKVSRGRYACPSTPLHNIHPLHESHSIHSVHKPEGGAPAVNAGVSVVNGAALHAHPSEPLARSALAASGAAVSLVNAVNGSADVDLGDDLPDDGPVPF